jgi:hypothetical protein
MNLSNLRFHLTRVSANKKTGPMPVTTSSRDTCPCTCPFRGSGCYADSGPLAIHWGKVTSAERGVTFSQHCDDLASLPSGQLVRLNQAGDIAHNRGKISRRFVRGIVAACKNLKAYSYTHHRLDVGENLQMLRFANRNGLTVNVSTETEASADRAIESGLPAVLAVSSEEARTTWRTAAGNLAMVCPAQLRETDCATCQLCHTRGRRVIIAFRAHGASKRKADQAILEAGRAM